MIPLRHPQIETAARKSLPAVGVKLHDLEGFSCCPEPWNFKGTSLENWLTLAARNLALGERSKRDMLTLCNGCASTLKEAAHILEENGDLRKSIGGKLKLEGLEFKGKKRGLHLVEVLETDKVEKSVKRPLSGMKVAIHHGCHLLRPSKIMGIDDPFNPHLLEDLVRALGGEPVIYSGYTDCCGNATRDRTAALKMGSEKLANMKEAGARCVVVVCPACFEQFDIGQLEMKRKLKVDHRLPVLHYCELLALAQGEHAKELGLDLHRVSVTPVVKAVG